MEITSTGDIHTTVGLSVLKTAIKQPELAAELIDRSLDFDASQQAKQVVRPVEVADGMGSGNTIDIRV